VTTGSGSDWRASLREAGPYLSLGMQMGFTVIGFAAAGFVADRYLGTRPWLTIAGGVVGLVMLIVLLVRTVKDANARSDRRRTRR
jgi:F0F1-type ATP synthase assembly protein I